MNIIILLKVFEIEACPSLNNPAVMCAVISTICSPECRCFKAKRYIVELELLFAFCV